MTDYPKFSSELPNTYVVQDRSQDKELARVRLQDRLFTMGMGGVLPEQSDPTRFQHILDVGCGTGDWLMEVAKAYPSSIELIGVDTSAQVLTYARAQAEAQDLAARITFRKMDALRMLEFPANTFDLVNQRLGMSYLRTWDWPKLLQEYRRVTRPEGCIRITESNLTTSSSPALDRLRELFLDAFYKAGHFFAREKDSIIQELPGLFERQGLQNIRTRAHLLQYRAGTTEGEQYIEDVQHTYRLIVPFLQKWTRVPDDYDAIYQRALREMRDPDFETSQTLLTVWATNPSKEHDKGQD